MSYSLLRSAYSFSLAVLLLSAVAPLRADDDASAAARKEPPAPSVALPRTATLAPIGLRFTYPADFAEGRYKPDPDPIAWLLNNALVLVEADDIDPANLDRLECGGQSAISIHPLNHGFKAECVMRHARPEWKCLIGEKLVYKFPWYPGPCGEFLHCYVLPLPDGSAVLFIANRFHHGEKDWPITTGSSNASSPPQTSNNTSPRRTNEPTCSNRYISATTEPSEAPPRHHPPLHRAPGAAGNRDLDGQLPTLLSGIARLLGSR